MYYEMVRDHGVVVGATVAATMLTLAFGLGWSVAIFAWLNPILVSKLRYILKAK
jgi:hypothetical protein